MQKINQSHLTSNTTTTSFYFCAILERVRQAYSGKEGEENSSQLA